MALDRRWTTAPTDPRLRTAVTDARLRAFSSDGAAARLRPTATGVAVGTERPQLGSAGRNWERQAQALW